MAALIPSASWILAGPVDLGDVWRGVAAVNQQLDLLRVALAFLVIAAVVARAAPQERGSVRTALRLFFTGVVLLLAPAALDLLELGKLSRFSHWIGLAIGGIAIVSLASLFVFDVLLKISHLTVPRILRDLLVGIAYVAVLFTLLSRAGISLGQLITTSAILTAVIGLSMQDTLGNIMAGVALQLEKTIAVGDWVKIDQTVGRITEIRWRHTSIETRNWDTVIVPNTQLIKSQVTILGRRTSQPLQHRQWVYFNVDFRYSPTEVIHAVTEALTAEPIENVSPTPKPNCILYDIKESFCYYAVRYWLTNLAVDDPTDSRMRTIVYFALKRANIPMSIPAHKLFMTEESEAHEELSRQKDAARRMESLANVDLFDTLSIEERRKLAERLYFAPFTAGETITRQGAEAHWLYILTKGTAEVVVTEGDVRQTVNTLKAGDFFGEMSLMTGAKRSSTVTALEDTHCYRLDKAGFQEIIQRRPEIAAHVSKVMAERLVGLEAARSQLAEEIRKKRLHELEGDIFSRILNFFGIDREAGSQGV
ncbi:MAG TPA: cyclic nucleotide-binding domain-containing protein [Terriglobales bacterium]|nr:cyclic nucleotide-binding domain-containing protein [Terriglobales bacterium]